MTSYQQRLCQIAKPSPMVQSNTNENWVDITLQFYKQLPSDPTNTFMNEQLTLLDNLLTRGEITKREYDFLYSPFPKMAVFYTQPKIHKNLTKPPGRPIVSGIESLTANISTFVDFFLRPIVEKIPSYVNTRKAMAFFDAQNLFSCRYVWCNKTLPPLTL